MDDDKVLNTFIFTVIMLWTNNSVIENEKLLVNIIWINYEMSTEFKKWFGNDLLSVLQVKVLSQSEAPRGQYDPCRNYDSRSSSPASSDHARSQDSPAKTKPPPPPTALKPTFTSRASRGLNSPPVRDNEHMEKSPDDPSQRSFMGKVKAFEKMDHIARTQRVLELQEAQIARVSY